MLAGTHVDNSDSSCLQLNQIEDTPNSLGKYMFSANETMIIGNNIADEIVQGEDSETKNILLDDSCEELTLPQYFSDGKFRYIHDRDIEIDLSRYINQQLLNYLQRFTCNSDYIFWAQASLQKKFFRKQIPLSLRKK